MKTRLLSLLCFTLIAAACSAPALPDSPRAEPGTPTGAALSDADQLGTQRAERFATLHGYQTATAQAPTPTPRPTSTPVPTRTSTPTPTPGPSPMPTTTPDYSTGMGGGCAQGCGGGGGGGGDGYEESPYAELGPPAGEQAEGPVPTPDMMFFEDYGTNPFVVAASDSLSTFAVDVDTGSYTLTRRYLNEGLLPPPEAIRLEEFVNYFRQDYPIPTQEEVFSISLEAAPTVFNAADNYVLRVGVQGYEVDPAQRPDVNLVFVIDVSGSMDRENRLEAVKKALGDLVDQLRPTDTIGIVAFTTDAFVVLQPTPVSQAETIKAAINPLHPMDSTNVESGLLLGYQMAYDNLDPARINRIILCSDGVANVSEVDPNRILETVRQYADDITLTTVGFGMGNYNDVVMEQLADNGGGQYFYVDSYPEARRIFIDKLTSTLVTIAEDVKIQVEFNPNTVGYYRLMGYENRDIADTDFRDDSVDGGEIGAGHSVTALYEIVPTDYNRQGAIATVTLRWLDPNSGAAREISHTIEVWERRQNLEDTTARFQLDIAAAGFADLLGEGAWARQVTWDDLLALSAWLVGGFPDDADVVEFETLVRRAYDLSGA